jgi:Fic/DOC family N-terminal
MGKDRLNGIERSVLNSMKIRHAWRRLICRFDAQRPSRRKGRRSLMGQPQFGLGSSSHPHTVSPRIQPAFCIKPSRHNAVCCNQMANDFTQMLWSRPDFYSMKKPFNPGLLPRKDIEWEQLIPLIGAANRALAHYDGALYGVPNPAVLLSPMTTQEAVLSSRIEGTQATLGDVLKFEAGEEPKQEKIRYRRDQQLPAGSAARRKGA